VTQGLALFASLLLDSFRLGLREQSPHRLLRKDNDREDSENCPERNEETFDAGDHQREGVTVATGKASTSNQNTDRHCYTCEKENRAQHDKYPANECWRWFLIVRARMSGSVKKESANHRIEQREKRKQSSHTGDYVMKRSPAVADGLRLGSRCDIAFLSMLIDVEPLTLDLRRNPQTDCSSHQRANEGASYHRQHDRDHDCF
jgi:hypothetical protein